MDEWLCLSLWVTVNETPRVQNLDIFFHPLALYSHIHNMVLYDALSQNLKQYVRALNFCPHNFWVLTKQKSPFNAALESPYLRTSRIHQLRDLPCRTTLAACTGLVSQLAPMYFSQYLHIVHWSRLRVIININRNQKVPC